VDLSSYPVHESLSVQQGKDIYRTEEWHKAVVQYQFESDRDTLETAVYLWHNHEDGWKRKNKYVIKSTEAWEDDRPVINWMFDTLEESPAGPNVRKLPVSDYFSVRHAQTIFKSDEWWKAIVHVDQKGDYETNEIIIYLWQMSDGEWRRRQKYAIKSEDDWQKERNIISEFLGVPTEEYAKTLTEDDGILGDIESEFEPHREENHVSETISEQQNIT